MFVFIALGLIACDLRPRILSLPDDIGAFISERYPAMLANPETEPEIYNSAATDYGVYASPDMYGSPGDTDDYILYSSQSDYDMPAQPAVPVIEYGNEVVMAPDDYLSVPEYGTYLTPTPPTTHAVVMAKPVRAQMGEITVARGDTLYSISRRTATPVNDLAVMNKLSPPFNLSVGQKLKVPVVTEVAMPGKPSVKVAAASVAVTPAAPKISSAPTKPLPKIAARSGAKFTRPLRGTIISAYGAKSNGLFNDGINIGASRGATVGAAENGVVAYAGNELKGMGNLIIIQHSDGWMTVYAHLDTMSVRRGAKVSVGQKIGTVGQTGKVDKPQLHFEIRKGTKAYNPNDYMKK